MFSIDFDKLAKDLLIREWRLPKRIALAEVVISPVKSIYTSLLSYIDEKKREASYNFETQNIERMLNDKWPAAGGGIYIDHTNNLKPRWFGFYEDEGQPALGYGRYEDEGEPVLGYGYYEEEYATDYDFKVMVPVALVFDEAQMRSWINKYRFAGIRYTIETY